MDTYPYLPAIPAQRRIDLALSEAGNWLRRTGAEWDAEVREHPRRAILLALAAGAMTRRLPLPTLVMGALKTLWAATPPALALLGAFKVADYVRQLDDSSRPLENADEGRRIIMPDSTVAAENAVA